MELKTIAEQLNIKKFPFEIKDSSKRTIYIEYSDKSWEKWEFDLNGNEIYSENSDGFWKKREYNSDGIEYLFSNSNGYWKRYELDSNGYPIYFEESCGQITYIDNPSDYIK